MTADATLLLTGGTGFLGRAMLRYIDSLFRQRISLPWSRVFVITRSSRKFIESYPYFSGLEWLTLLNADILDTATLSSDLPVKYVIHAAADSTIGADLHPLFRFEQIVNGTRNILEWSVKAGVERFLFLSSGAVYGELSESNLQVSERHSVAPLTTDVSASYGNAKRAAESLCCLYQASSPLECVIARCFSFVGMDIPLGVHFAIGNFIRDARLGSTIIVKGSGSPIRSYMDQTEAAYWLLNLLLFGRKGQAYNVGSDEAISILELAKLVQRTLNPNLEVEVQGKGVFDQRRTRYVPDVSLCKSDLDLRVTIPLESAIASAAAGHCSRIQSLRGCMPRPVAV